MEMNAGDATRDISDKKWTAELRAYKDARAQGIQPNSTHMPDIRKAHEASEILGRAYNGDTMPKANKITKKTVEVMKEIDRGGAIPGLRPAGFSRRVLRRGRSRFRSRWGDSGGF